MLIGLFLKLMVAGLTLVCLAVSLLTWRDGRGRTPAPVWWTAGYAALLAASVTWFLPHHGWLSAAELLGLDAAVSLQLMGFFRFHRLENPWALAPAWAASPVLALAAAFPLEHDPQLSQLAATAFFPLLGVCLAVQALIWRGRKIRVPWWGFGAMALVLVGFGTFRFAQAAVWSTAWYWYRTEPGQIVMTLSLVFLLAVLVQYQLRLVNRHYLDRLGGLDRELAQAQREVLVTLAEVIERSSHETAGHVLRVGEYASFLAQAAGWRRSEAQFLGEAAHLHDIGKIGIPDRILDQEGPLARADLQVMQTHAAIGFGILSRSDRPLFRMAARIALEHHENWDGTGYPRGLEGQAISMEGRIVALADVFDALSQRRPYKEPWPLDQIFAYLESQKGKKFDPDLVDLWLSRRPQIEALVRELQPAEAEQPVA